MVFRLSAHKRVISVRAEETKSRRGVGRTRDARASDKASDKATRRATKHERTGEMTERTGKTMMSEIPVPVFKDNNFEMYKQQVEKWARISGVDKEKQAAILWLTLPDESASDIKTKIYKEIKEELKKEVGVQMLLNIMAEAFKPAKQSQVQDVTQKDAIKLEVEYYTEEEEALLAGRGYYRGSGRGGGRGGSYNGGRGGGGSWSGGGGGWSGGGAGARAAGRPAKPERDVKRPLNPKGQDGERLLCLACGSYRHMMMDCQHSWERMKGKAFVVEEQEQEESYFTMANRPGVSDEEDDVILFTGNSKERINSLGSETLGRLLLDTGCTRRNVCGEAWWSDYYKNLTEEDKGKVKEEEGGGKKFRFGGGEVLTALSKVSFPAQLAGKVVRIDSHVVSSPIPLLWSKANMMRAGVMVHRQGDRARILGRWMDLDTTYDGHHALYILPENGGARKEFRAELGAEVRAVERRYTAGEEVYYKRDSDRGEWRGPATVIGNRGTLHFLVYQGELVRVAACRMVHTGEAEEQMGDHDHSEHSKVGEEPETSLENARSAEAPSPTAVEVLHREERQVVAPAEEQELQQAQPELAAEQRPEEEQEGAEVRAGEQGGEGGGMELLEKPNPEVAVARGRKEQRPEEEQEGAEVRAGEQGGEGGGMELLEKPNPEVAVAREAAKPRRTESAPVRRPVVHKVQYPRAGDRIQFKEGEEWRDRTVIGRGAKMTSKTHTNYFNVRKEDSGAAGMDLDKSEWRFNVQEAVEEEKEEEVNFTLTPIKDHGKEECVAAKKKELATFDDFGVYEEVEDKGRDALSSRWILTDKSTEEEKKVKARLVARGFEEKVKVQADSPTGSKDDIFYAGTVKFEAEVMKKVAQEFLIGRTEDEIQRMRRLTGQINEMELSSKIKMAQLKDLKKGVNPDKVMEVFEEGRLPKKKRKME